MAQPGTNGRNRPIEGEHPHVYLDGNMSLSFTPIATSSETLRTSPAQLRGTDKKWISCEF
jgi:hypothetical protein